MKFIWGYLICFFGGLLMTVAYKFRFPERMNFVKEGGAIEDITVLFFFLASIVSFWAIFKSKEKLFSAVVSLLGLASFADELEWGRKILGYKAVLYIGKTRIDSVHDFLGPLYKVFKKKWDNEIFFIFELLLLSLIIFLIKKNIHYLTNLFFSKKIIFVGIIFCLFVGSFLLDHGIIIFPKTWLINSVIIEEYLELGGAMALFFLSLNILLENRKTEKV